MKKKLLLALFIGGVVLTLTGCGKKEIKGPFTINCEGVDNDQLGVKQTIISSYNFGQDQYLTNYSIKTVSIYENDEAYKIYRDSAFDAKEDSEESSLEYNVASDDETKTVTVEYKITIDKTDLDASDDKNFYKAASVLERAKSNSNVKCTFDGVEESQIK